MKKFLILTVSSMLVSVAAPAMAETQSETIARICGEHGQQSAECKSVSGNQAQLNPFATSETSSGSDSKTCNLPSDNALWGFWDGDGQIGSVRLAATRSGLTMDGTVADMKISYRIQACIGNGEGVLVPNHGTDGPPEIFLNSIAANEVQLFFVDQDGSEAVFSLIRQ